VIALAVMVRCEESTYGGMARVAVTLLAADRKHRYIRVHIPKHSQNILFCKTLLHHLPTPVRAIKEPA
jgi:hypothetical protein